MRKVGTGSFHGTGRQAQDRQALRASSQDPNPQDVTSNTQWSVVYSNTDLAADIALRRHWSDITHFQL